VASRRRPGLHELLHALVLEHQEHVSEVDAERFQLVEHVVRFDGLAR
jgi:hypothetical protein